MFNSYRIFTLMGLLVWVNVVQSEVITVNLSLSKNYIIEGESFKLIASLTGGTANNDIYLYIDGPGPNRTIGDDLEAEESFPAMLQIPTGQTEAYINIKAIQDDLSEGTESFGFAITSVDYYPTQVQHPTPVQLGQTIASGTIQDKAEEALGGPAVNPVQDNTAQTLGKICDSGNASPDLQERCRELVEHSNTNPNEVANALQQIAPEEYSTQSTIALRTPTTQIRNVEKRLDVVRCGSPSISLSGLRFNLVVNGQSLPLQTFTHLLPLSADNVAYYNLYREEHRHEDEFYEASLMSQQLLAAHLLSLQNNASEITTLNISKFSRLGVFVNGEINFGNHDTTNRGSGFKFSTQGLTAGIDYRFTDQLIGGIAVGYTNEETDLNGGGGNIDGRGYSFTLYGTFYRTDDFYIEGLYSYGRNRYDNQRHIVYQVGNTNVNQTASSNNNSYQQAFGLGLGYHINQESFTFTPTVRLDYIKTKIDGFNEQLSHPGGAGAGLGLAIDAQKVKSLTMTLGIQADYIISQSWGILIPHINLNLVYEFKDDIRFPTGRFLDDTGGEIFTGSSDPIGQHYLNLGLGKLAQFTEGRSAFLRYENTLGLQDIERHAIMVGVRLEF